MIEWLQSNFVALLQVVMIDVVLAGDNAVIVGLAASRVAPELRARVIFWGLAGAVLLRVSDTGRGMTAEQLQQAFEPFNRLGLEQEAIEGTGIGLAIVQALVERMGGRIGASSTPGAGSSFEVRLPEAADGATTTPQPADSDGVPPLSTRSDGRPRKLLYIEDNPVNLLIVQEVLSLRPEFELLSATSGLQGVALALAERPDLVLVDMQLPDIDGMEVLRRLRAHEATRDLRCISVSANALPEDMQRALRAGFADYWTKPLDLGRFMRSLDAVFDAMDAALR